MIRIKSSLLVICLFVFVSCSHSGLQSRKSGKQAYSYLDFEQLAPASLTPKFKDDGSLDDLHMKMQADYYFTMAEAYALEGQADKAIDSYKLTLAYDPSAYEVRVKLAAEYLKKGYVSEAIEQASLALELREDLMSANFLLAGVYTSLKMFDKAKAQYKKIVELRPNNEEARLYLGAIYVEEKNWPAAKKEFSYVANLNEAKVAHLGFFYLGKIYDMEKNHKKAEESYLKVLSIQPDFIDAILSLGTAYEQTSKAKAINFYKSYLDKHGNNEKVLEILATMYIEEERYDLALKYFEDLEAMTGSLNARVKVAMIYIEQKKYSEAIERLNQILAEVPESDKIRFYLAAVYEEIKEYQKAVDLYKQIPLASSYFVDASVHGIYLTKVLGKTEEAIKWNEAALQKRSDVIQFYTLYASLLDEKKSYQAAVDFLTGAEKNFPDSPQIQYFLGSFFDKVGNKREAINRMHKVLDLNENHSQALNFLAYTMAELEEDLEQAELYALRAIELKPQDAYYLDTLGWVYYKQGEIEKAIQYLEVALKLKPNESIIAHHLGDAYYSYKLPQKAISYYQHALKHEKDKDEKNKINEKVASVQKSLSLPSANNITNESQKERSPAAVND